MDSNRPAYFEMSFAPNVELVSSVRRFVSSFYGRLFDSADAAAQVALATHELLENAVRYSKDEVTTLRVQVERVGLDGRVTITTKNRARAEDVDIIRKAIAEIAATEDPFVLYQQKMRESARRREGSGLGLARVRAEADMEISCVIEDDIVSISGCAQFRNEV